MRKMFCCFAVPTPTVPPCKIKIYPTGRPRRKGNGLDNENIRIRNPCKGPHGYRPSVKLPKPRVQRVLVCVLPSPRRRGPRTIFISRTINLRGFRRRTFRFKRSSGILFTNKVWSLVLVFLLWRHSDFVINSEKNKNKALAKHI